MLDNIREVDLGLGGTPSQDTWYSKKDLLTLLNISVRTLERRVRSGAIMNKYSGGKWLYKLADGETVDFVGKPTTIQGAPDKSDSTCRVIVIEGLSFEEAKELVNAS